MHMYLSKTKWLNLGISSINSQVFEINLISIRETLKALPRHITESITMLQKEAPKRGVKRIMSQGINIIS